MGEICEYLTAEGAVVESVRAVEPHKIGKKPDFGWNSVVFEPCRPNQEMLKASQLPQEVVVVVPIIVDYVVGDV